MSSGGALLAAAGGVGFGHAVLPDHWAPLAVVGRKERYSLGRVAQLAALAGVAHVLVSVLLGTLIVVAGLPLRHVVAGAQDAIVGGLLILTGVGFMTLQLSGRGHHHSGPHHHDHHHAHHHDHHHRRWSSLATIMVPFGAAASPDLTILPVFLAAAATGPVAAVGSLIVFAALTIGTIVGLTVAAAAGGYRVPEPWLERWGNLFTAAVLIAIGGLVAGGVL